MKLKKLINTLPSRQTVTIYNHNEELIVEGSITDITIITDALGDKEVLSTYSDIDYLDKDYLTIVLDTLIDKKDISRALSDYFKTLSYNEIALITGNKVGLKVREE